MAFKKKPVNGMKDILPKEMEVRDYVTGVIKDTYRSYGFTPIETPCMEDISNLSGSKGGENEKLIFKILKRGEKLKLDSNSTEESVVDYGMRYDLTVPLSRYYAAHENELTSPFKALQIGNVWRADRPQRGRYRQFTQCDIDILGEPSNLAEIELILATSTTLGRLGFSGFEIRINDREILKQMALYVGFKEEDFDLVFIILDKIDKIGYAGAENELVENGYSEESASKYMELFRSLLPYGDVGLALMELKKIMGDNLSDEVVNNLVSIADTVEEAKEADFHVVFDPSLVRGMGYYTGTIFEISIPEFGGSCGGGGRYDEMVGRFLGKDVPACGFSIGFERIILLLLEKGFEIPDAGERVAYLVEKNYPHNKLNEVFIKAKEARNSGKQVLVVRMNKNKKHQKELLREQGYETFEEFFAD